MPPKVVTRDVDMGEGSKLPSPRTRSAAAKAKAPSVITQEAFGQLLTRMAAVEARAESAEQRILKVEEESEALKDTVEHPTRARTIPYDSTLITPIELRQTTPYPVGGTTTEKKILPPLALPGRESRSSILNWVWAAVNAFPKYRTREEWTQDLLRNLAEPVRQQLTRMDRLGELPAATIGLKICEVYGVSTQLMVDHLQKIKSEGLNTSVLMTKDDQG